MTQAPPRRHALVQRGAHYFEEIAFPCSVALKVLGVSFSRGPKVLAAPHGMLDSAFPIWTIRMQKSVYKSSEWSIYRACRFLMVLAQSELVTPLVPQCIYIHICVCIYIYMYIYMCVCVCVYVHIHTYIYMCVCVYTYIHIHIYIYIHTYIHIYIHIHTYIHTYTYTFI